MKVSIVCVLLKSCQDIVTRKEDDIKYSTHIFHYRELMLFKLLISLLYDTNMTCLEYNLVTVLDLF